MILQVLLAAFILVAIIAGAAVLVGGAVFAVFVAVTASVRWIRRFVWLCRGFRGYLDLLATPEGREFLRRHRDHVYGPDPLSAPVLEGRYLQLLAAPYGDDGDTDNRHDHDEEHARDTA